MAFWNISLDTANQFYAWGWRASIAGAIITAVAVFFLMWGTRVRDHDFESQMSRLNLSAAESNERAAKLEKEAQELKFELAKLQPRNITPGQHAMIVSFLQNTDKGPVVVIWKQFDEEAENFAKQIMDVLKDAGFDVKEDHGPMTFGRAGTWIVVRDLQKLQTTPSYAGAIQAAFNSTLHIDFNGAQRKDPFPDLGEVVIAIGARP